MPPPDERRPDPLHRAPCGLYLVAWTFAGCFVAGLLIVAVALGVM